MLAITATTPHRKRQRRHARLPIAMAHHPRAVPVVVLPAPSSAPAPVAAWSDPDTRHSDLDLATWEDAEWR
jgi:hypothetical protein